MNVEPSLLTASNLLKILIKLNSFAVNVPLDTLFKTKELIKPHVFFAIFKIVLTVPEELIPVLNVTKNLSYGMKKKMMIP